MRNKVVIGVDISVDAQRILDAESAATEAAAEVTMIKRRIRTFYTAVTEVHFPTGAPSWATDWLEWLITGEIEPVEVVEEPPVA